MDARRQREIAQGLSRGKTEAWLLLYDTYCRQVWNHVARLMGPHSEDIADIVQETFLAAARSAGGYEPARGSLWLWLGGIARNQVALHFRRRERTDRVRRRLDASQGQPDREEIARWLNNREAAPDAALVTAETVSMVRDTLTLLPDHYERVLTAKYFAGASVEQIAAVENTTTTAIRSKLARARRAFRNLCARTSVDSSNSRDREHHES
jgi:RNA polymerase sigma-70 factor, ECF subfamily